MHIEFAIRCDACGQRLTTTDGTSYSHNNADDCEYGSSEVILPRVTPDDLRAALAGPVLDELNVEARAALSDIQKDAKPKKATKKKAVTKKATKGKSK